MNYKLPFLKIIIGALFFAWTNKAALLKAISIPTLILVAIWGIWLYSTDKLPSAFTWMILLGYGLSFSFFAITCHRLILADGIERFKPFKAKPGYRELKFLAWVIAIYAIKSILERISMDIALNAGGSAFIEDGGGIPEWIKLISSIPALYVFARLCLTFPATAIDRSSGLRWSWIRTRGNGWRIFIIVGLFPWLIGMAIWFMWREEASILEQVVLTILGFIGLSIEIIALSFTYKDLAKQYASSEQFITSGINSTLTEASLDSFHELALDGKNQKLYTALKFVTGLGLCYLFLGSLTPHLVGYFANCESELISNAISPGRSYRAELFNQTCKDKKGSELVLDIVRTATQKTITSYTISKTVSSGVDLKWASEHRLLVRNAEMLDLADTPIEFDDIQIIFEKELKK